MRICTVLFLFAMAAVIPARAQGPGAEPAAREPWEQTLIHDNIKIAKFFDGIAEGIDLFLAGERLTNQRNETNVKLENFTFSDEGAPFANSTGLSVNLRLPNVERYWHLKFATYDEREERRGVRAGYLRQTPREQNVGATLGLFKKLGNVRTSFEPRIELSNPLKVSHSLTFESVADLKTYQVNPKLEFYADPEKGTGNFLAFNVHIELTKIYSLTFINEGEYIEKQHLLSTTNGFSVGQILTDAASIGYSLIFGSNNQPSYHLADYSFAVTYADIPYKKIFEYRVGPHINFKGENDFRPTLGASLIMSVIF